MTAKTKKPQATPADPALIERVLRELEQERLTVHRAMDEAGAAMMAEDRKWAERLAPLLRAKDDADAEALTHERRYKALLTPKEFDAAQRALEAKREDAQRRHENMMAEARKAVTLLQKPHGELNAKAENLRREWDANARWARAAGIDLTGFWTPGEPYPPEPAPAAEPEAEAPPEE